MKIVTSGAPFIDIDAYACMVAFSELLNQRGIKSRPYSSSRLNDSIPSTVISWGDVSLGLQEPNKEDVFILVDSSNPLSVDKNAVVSKIEMIIDHRLQFYDLWQNNSSTEVEIESVGAAATLIYEKWLQYPTLFMSKLSARLLLTAIIDNTLGLRSLGTTNRDRQAMMGLQAIAQLPNNWEEQYFIECEKLISTEVEVAIRNDKKLYKTSKLDKRIEFDQLIVWDVDKMAQSTKDKLIRYSNEHPNSFLNLVGVSQNKSYFLSANRQIIRWLETLSGPLEKQEYAWLSNRAYLRKELIEIDQKWIIK